ncbi:acyltransferase family protein [Phaeacidiphilus oryzae]|uniref:acyltransferase family protein n=1 Tax=Phaeacidiphilus oryzae TaxID=348818 RepID=UPI0007C833B9|nr:acyltransferase [Phaeacidiphilus oryzae]
MAAAASAAASAAGPAAASVAPTAAAPAAPAEAGPAAAGPAAGFRPPALPSLTGMRWGAALLVFGLHTHNLLLVHGTSGAAATWAFTSGATGVSFFFILSGFVLAWTARPGATRLPDVRRFWRRRIARIYPVHLVTALLALLLALWLTPDGLPSAKQIAANLLLVHTWKGDWWQTLDSVSWSLACEAFFYAVFPLLQRLVLDPLARRPRRTTALAACCAALVAVLPWVDAHFALNWQMNSQPLLRLPEFVLGALLALLVRGGHWRGPAPDAALAVALLGYFGAAQLAAGSPYAYSACTVLGFALLIAAGATADLRGERCFWRRRALVRLGELSFAFYMVHLLVLRAALRLPDAVTHHTAFAAAVLVTALGCAWLVERGVELPARRLILAPPLWVTRWAQWRQRQKGWPAGSA